MRYLYYSDSLLLAFVEPYSFATRRDTLITVLTGPLDSKTLDNMADATSQRHVGEGEVVAAQDAVAIEVKKTGGIYPHKCAR